MVTGILVIAAAIGLVVLLLEGIRYRRWAGIPPWDLGLGLGLVAVVALGFWLGQLPATVPVALLLGGLVGVGLLALRGCGRAGQGLGVLLLSLATGASVQGFEMGVAGLTAAGLGLGLVGIPLVGRLGEPTAGAETEGMPLLLALAQGWMGIAAFAWGSRLMEMGADQDIPWQVLLPVGLAALSLVAGTVPLLTTPEGESTSSGLLWVLGHGVGWLVATTLALVLVRNGLYQDPFWALLYGVGGLLSWGLLGLQAQDSLSALSNPGEAASAGQSANPSVQRGLLLWRACLGLLLVGGGALLALRLGGSYGAALLGLGCLAFPSRWGAMAALFLAARPLLQNLLHQFNLQTAGIDLTQPYVSAALYLGIAGMLLAALIQGLYGQDNPRRVGIGLTVAALILPLGVGYFIHAQPQAAFLLAALMTALVLAVMDSVPLTGMEPVFWRSGSPGGAALGFGGAQGLCLTVMAILGASLSRDWTVTGFYATRLERALVLGGIGGVLLLLLLLWQGWRVWQQVRLQPRR
ncbi:hypothetical protein [Thermostichus vulcanus]|uniref:MFS transporter n=1 Tax=Thermostichus vulcanus str. 'Rupite' TaxID=2813851 RepID=A0ABT0CEV5_THEVL|nr:hypothetical protein [Thermostichus vulcanus]MCJ2544322.1 hypothetical protein [Thermostichus vulcanus str. 'Rupite']